MIQTVFPTHFGWMFLPLLFFGVSAVSRMIRTAASKRSGRSFGNDTLPETVSEAAIYRFAQKMGGRITVSDLVVETGASTVEAEKVLKEITDGVHVQMEVSKDGVVWYEFPEILRRSSATKHSQEGEAEDGL